jgi:hypothetical protein
MRNYFQIKRLTSYKFLYLVLMITACSCSTARLIPFHQVNARHNPNVIRLKDSSEYTIYSNKISCQVSEDTLLVFDQRNLKTLEVIPKTSINQLVKKSGISNDSLFRSDFFWFLFDTVFDIIIY